MEVKRCPGCMQLKYNRICEHCGHDGGSNNSSHQLPQGVILKEQYQIGKVLGQGGFGITYLGWDMYLDIPVAIKEYYPQGIVMRDSAVTLSVVDCSAEDDSRFRNNRERFLREAKMLARFSQIPEIVQVKNFFLANNTAYIVMEYVEGINLKRYVEKMGGKLTPAETFRIFAPIINTLAKIHKSGIVHRDISPDNIMMCPDGCPKLLDFGAVRDVGMAQPDKSLTRSTEAIVKPGYAPIEQYQKRGVLGPWSDVYALCSTIYFCLTGQPPEDAPERVLGDGDMNWDIPGLTRRQRDALRAGMEIRVENRIQDMQKLYDALFETGAAPAEEKKQPEPPVKKLTTKEPVRPAGKKTGDPAKKQKKAKPLTSAGENGAKPASRQKNKNWWDSSLLFVALMLIPVILAVVSLSMPADSAEPQTPSIFHEVKQGTCGEDVRWSLDLDTGALVIDGNGAMEDYCGDWFEPTPAEEELAPWYPYREQILSLTFKGSVTRIGKCAFAGCMNLSEVTLPESLLSISESAFLGTGIQSLELPDKLVSIGSGAFAYTKLEEIDLTHVRMLGESAFSDCENLRRATLGEQTEMSYRSAIFSNSSPSRIEGITLRLYGNTLAEDYARVYGYATVEIGESQWDISGACGNNLQWYFDVGSHFLKIEGEGKMPDFAGAETDYVEGRRTATPWSDIRNTVRYVSIGDGITELGEYAFAHSQLREIQLGHTVEVIPFHTFLGTPLEYIRIPESVRTIESFAFNHCGSLFSVVLPDSLKVLEEATFNACGNLQELWIGEKTKIRSRDYTPFNHEMEPAMPANLKIYGFPKSDAEIFANERGIPFGAGWNGMVGHQEGKIGDDVWWALCDDVLVIYGTGETYRYNLSTFDIRDWAKDAYLAGQAFVHDTDFAQYREQIRCIQVRPGVEGLMNGLFDRLTNLQIVDLGTVQYCHSHFSSCLSLEEIVFPETVSEVGSYLFVNCTNLRKVTFLAPKVDIYEQIFSGCSALEEVWFSPKAKIHGYLGGSLHAIYYVKENSNAHKYAQEHKINVELY